MTTGRTRWLVISLAVSMGLNLFFAGFWVARGLRGESARRPPHHAGFGAALRMTDALAPGEGQELRKQIRQQMKQLRPQRQNLRVARAEVRDAMAAEPFDRQRLEKALGSVRQQTDQTQQALHGVLVDFAGGLTPEQRKRWVQAGRGRQVGRGIPK